jgi:hypothetical protein
MFHEERAQCTICCEVLVNESFKENKFMQQLKTKQNSLADRGAEFFKRKAETVNKTRLYDCGSYQQNNAAVIEAASYLVAQKFAKAKKPLALKLVQPLLKQGQCGYIIFIIHPV